MQLSLTDQTVLVTGGGSGIGKGVATAAAASGANAMLVGRNADKLAAPQTRSAPRTRGGAVLYEPADVTNEDEVSRVVEAATAWTGRLHGVVHCAGGSETIGPVTQIDSDAWRRTVDLNINGTMYVLKHAAREMVRGGGGSFIGISSIAASNTHRWFGAYGVSKAGIDHLMQLAADELGPSWVRVNCIRPGLIRTELVAPVFDSPEVSGDYAAITPLPRAGEVEDIANAATFLLSDASSYITGQVINVDGGDAAARPRLLGDARTGLRRRRSARGRVELAIGRVGSTGLPCCQRTDRRPVEFCAAAGEQCEEAISDQAGHRHRHLQFLGGGEYKADVLVPERRCEARRLESFACDQPAVGLVDRGAEQRRGHDLQVHVFVDARLADQRHRLAERLDDRCDQEVAAQLHQVGGFGSSDTMNVRWPIASNAGDNASIVAGSPAATTNSLAACAASGLPNTGAETNFWPASACAAANRSASATLIVEPRRGRRPRRGMPRCRRRRT